MEDPGDARTRLDRLAVGAEQVLLVARTRDIRLKTIRRTLREVSEISGSALGVARTSVWLIEGDDLRCVQLVAGGTAIDEPTPAVLPTSACAGYLARLDGQQTVAVA